MLSKLTCSSCNANYLVRRDGYWECDYCGATYVIDTKHSGSPTDAKVSGNMQRSVETYAIHGKLVVRGNMNEIRILRASRDAVHVRNLVVSGNMNNVSVVLLDGAKSAVRGNMNSLVRD